MNLLHETINVLSQHGLTSADVEWVGNCLNDTWGTWEDFVKLADFDYDNGFGLQEINASLVVMGKNWWLERVEYDGSEGWQFQTKAHQPTKNELKKEDLLEP